MSQPGTSNDFGVMRHYRASEDLFLELSKANGTPYVGGSLGAADIKVTLFFPDGTTKAKHTGTIPAGTLTSLGGGLYRLKLWGEGKPAGTDVDLAQAGRCGVLVEDGSGAAHFANVGGSYDVRPDFDVQFAVAYVPGSGGSDQISGAFSFHRWWSHELMLAPLTGTVPITGLTLRISDKDSVAALVTISGADFVESAFDGNVYFTKPISGVTGARALTARLTGSWKGFAIQHDFLIQVPVAA